jgi:hypothetical protein
MVDELSNLENTSSEVDMENINLMVTYLDTSKNCLFIANSWSLLASDKRIWLVSLLNRLYIFLAEWNSCLDDFVHRVLEDERFTELNYMVDELSNLENTSSEVDMENINLMVTFW